MSKKTNNYIQTPEKNQVFQLEQGLKNQRTIVQYPNKTWPFWVYKQFNPESSQFNSHSNPLSANNTTCRNWTQIGFPFSNQKVLIDPTGMITSLDHLWSLESWIAIDNQLYVLSQSNNIKQQLSKSAPKLLTKYKYEPIHIESEVVLNPLTNTEKLCINHIKLTNTTEKPLNITFFYVIQPYTPEGVSHIRDITYLSNHSFIVNEKLGLILDQKPDNIICACFSDEDLSKMWNKWDMILKTTCPNNMATALASFKVKLNPEEHTSYSCKIPLIEHSLLSKKNFSKPHQAEKSKKLKNQVSQYQSLNARHESTHVSYKWEELMKDKVFLKLPDKKYERLFQDNCHHLLNFTSKTQLYTSVLPYSNNINESFDIILALNQIGFADRSSHFIMHLPYLKGWVVGPLKSSIEKAKLLLAIYTTSQYTKDLDPEKMFYKCHLLAKSMKTHLRKLDETHHLSHYLWILGAYKVMFYLAKKLKKEKYIKLYHSRFIVLKSEIESFAKHTSDIHHIKPILPVTKCIIQDSRLLDNLACIYPLELYPYDNTWVRNTIHHLEPILINNLAFNYQDPIGYSSLNNIYLAQAYIGTKNEKAFTIISWLNQIATGTSNWPEAIHPQNKTGSAGNGHFGPSSAAYISLILRLLIKVKENTIYIFPFIPKEWFEEGKEISCNNCPTPFGSISFQATIEKNKALVSWTQNFHTTPKEILVCSPKPLLKYTFNNQTHTTTKTHATLPPQVSKVDLYFS